MSAATLLLQLVGPMQSWGTSSRFDERDTQLEPSKSGVIGLVCAALGRDRSDPVNDLAALRMGVRVEREGVALRDYQTVTGAITASGKPRSKGKETIVSRRYYLADAAFLVGLEGDDRVLLQRIHAALKAPAWPLALGRKSCVPSLPPYLPDGLVDTPLDSALRDWPRLVSAHSPDTARRYAFEHPSEGSVRFDQPLGPFAARQFGPRFVKFEWILAGGQHVPDSSAVRPAGCRGPP